MNPIKLRTTTQRGGKFLYYSLTVPPELVKKMPNPEDLQFLPEITDEGILFRVIGEIVYKPPKNWGK